MPTKRTEDLEDLSIEAGVSIFTGKPFCQILAHNDTTILRGQLAPDEIREMALGWLEAAEAADQDAVVVEVLTKVLDRDKELAKVVAADVVFRLRERRKK